MKERHRDRRGLPWIGGTAGDLRYVSRTLARHPGFTAVAILVFALGIGINAALFSLTNALFFRPPAVEDPQQLVHIYDVNGAGRIAPALDPGAFEYFRDHGEVFTELTGHWAVTQRLTVNEETELTPGEFVLSNYFDVLGVRARLGRTLQIADDRSSGDPTAMVISSRLWERRFNRDPGVIGRRVQLCCRPAVPGSALDPMGEFVIVGVMAAEFKGVAGRLSATDFWVPARWTGGDRPVLALAPFGRLKPDVSIDQAQAAVRHKGEIFLDEKRKDARPSTIDAWRGRRFEARPTAAIFDPFAPQDTTIARHAVAMSIVVGVVLLIASSNVAGLLTARSAHAAGDFAIRTAMGATRWRVGRLLVVESLLLALSGGAVGLAVAAWSLELFHAYAPWRIEVDTRLDARLLLVTFAVCLAAGVLTGLAPAVRAGRVDVLATLPGLGVSRSGWAHTRLRHTLLIPQVALSLAALTIAALHVTALFAMETADLGYETDQRVVVNVALRPQRGDSGANRDQQALRSRVFYRQLVQQARAPGIALASDLPLTPYVPEFQEVISRDRFSTGARSGVSASHVSISPGYFPTMGIRLLAGRDFDERDVRLEGKNGATQVPGGLVAIVSRSLARRLWDGRDTLGQSLALVSTWPGNVSQRIDWLRVVGLVDEVRPLLDAHAEVPFLYTPLGQAWHVFPNHLIAHAAGRAEPLVADLKRAATGASPFAEVYETRTLKQLVDGMLFQHRAMTALLAVSSAIGLLLACVGLCGVISYSVARRTHELGVRSALGANPTHIVGLVVKEAAVVTLIGMAFGGFLTYAALRVGVSALIRPGIDGATIGAVALALAVALFAACYIPARRAARIDPLESLRAL